MWHQPSRGRLTKCAASRVLGGLRTTDVKGDLDHIPATLGARACPGLPSKRVEAQGKIGTQDGWRTVLGRRAFWGARRAACVPLTEARCGTKGRGRKAFVPVSCPRSECQEALWIQAALGWGVGGELIQKRSFRPPAPGLVRGSPFLLCPSPTCPASPPWPEAGSAWGQGRQAAIFGGA